MLEALGASVYLPQSVRIGLLSGQAMMNYDYAVTDAAGVEILMRHGDQYDFNRQLAPDVLDKLDPEGKHVLMIIVYDHDRSGRPDIVDDPMHHRCLIYLKLKDQDKPAQAFIDVTDEDYLLLEHVTPARMHA